VACLLPILTVGLVLGGAMLVAEGQRRGTLYLAGDIPARGGAGGAYGLLAIAGMFLFFVCLRVWTVQRRILGHLRASATSRRERPSGTMPTTVTTRPRRPRRVRPATPTDGGAAHAKGIRASRVANCPWNKNVSPRHAMPAGRQVTDVITSR